MILHQFFLPRWHKMPFADKARCITRFFECLWQEDALMVYFHVPIGNLQFRIESFMASDPICKPYPSGIASSEDGSTAWRAHGTGGISITKCHPGFREFINVWSFMKVTPHARQCTPAEIINQKEHHIRLFIRKHPSRSCLPAFPTVDRLFFSSSYPYLKSIDSRFSIDLVSAVLSGIKLGIFFNALIPGKAFGVQRKDLVHFSPCIPLLLQLHDFFGMRL